MRNEVEKILQVFQPGNWEDGDIPGKKKKKRKVGELAYWGLEM